MITNLVVSLETARKLEAAGWNTPTELMWPEGKKHIIAADKGLVYDNDYFAPTAEEILKELPNEIRFLDADGNRDIAFLFIDKYTNGAWRIEYPDFFHGKEIKHSSLSEAAAQMRIWCKENNYLEVGK